MQSFKELLASGKLILFDGAVGTELYNRGVFINRSFEDSVLSQSSLIRIFISIMWGWSQVITTIAGEQILLN